jgi:hypothetical protein
MAGEKSEEVVQPVEGEQAPVVTEQQEPVHTELEQQAMAQGWQDKEAWVEAGHAPEDHRSAREFVDRGELLGKLKANSQELRNLRDSLAQMTQHNQRVYQAGIEQGIKQLKAERATALREGDVDHVLAIEERLEQHQNTLQEVKQSQRPIQQQPQGQQTPEFQQWVARNKWYLEDPVLHHWSRSMAIEFARVNPDAEEEEVYRFLDREVRKNFPDKFKKAAPPNPDGGGRQQSSAKANGAKGDFEKFLASIPEDEARAARNLVKNAPGLTPEKYMEQYRLINRES